jgi:GTPase SAR1 family protein
VFLIGNKVDLEEKRKVNKEVAEKFKDDYNLDLFMEASAKTGFNARTIFVEAAKLLFKDYLNYRDKAESVFFKNYKNFKNIESLEHKFLQT